MIKLISIIFILINFSIIHAQDVDYKKGKVVVDGKDYAKIVVTKQILGSAKTFEVFSMSDEKIIIAALATDYETGRKDNSFFFYRLTFLPTKQVGVFKVASLGQEKSFARLIGRSGILINDKTDEAKVKEFIAKEGAVAIIAADYTTVQRDKTWPIRLLKSKNFEQNAKIIGSFKSLGTYGESDHYELMLPSGVVVARVSFAGGNNAQNFELFTAKDNLKRAVAIPKKETTVVADASMDKNQFTLERIAKWLVDKQYL